VLLAIAVIVAGGIVILTRLRLLAMAVTCWAAFAAALAVVSAAGHCMTARWHVGQLCGREFWWVLVTSPEVLIFLCFMITDPRTIPRGTSARVAFAAAVGVVGALLIAPQRTEFAAKVALLGALTLACAARPAFERLFLGVRGERRRVRSVALATAALVSSAGGLVLAGAPARGDASTVVSDADFPAVPADALPSVSIAPGRLSSQVADADANAIAHDLVQDLEVQRGAVCARDLDLARASADRAWLDQLEAEMRRAAETREIDVPVYDLDTLVVSVAMRRGQSAPAVLATVAGTRRFERFGADCVTPEATTEPEPVSLTFEVLWNGQRYLVVSDELPEDFTPPTAP
jgi:hypothetical protein